MSVGFNHRPHPHHGSGIIDPEELMEAEDLLKSEIKVDTTHDVPFCAGMSEDGSTMYVDHAVNLKRGGIDRLKPLMVHEVIEWMLVKQFGMKYLEAHNLALAAEESCVRAAGIPQDVYNRLWDEDIRKVASRGKYRNIPADLQTEQYEEQGTKEEKAEMGLLGSKNKQSDPYDYPAKPMVSMGGKAYYRGKSYGV